MFKFDFKNNLDLSITFPCTVCEKDIPMTDGKGNPINAPECPHCKTPIAWKK